MVGITHETLGSNVTDRLFVYFRWTYGKTTVEVKRCKHSVPNSQIEILSEALKVRFGGGLLPSTSFTNRARSPLHNFSKLICVHCL